MIGNDKGPRHLRRHEEKRGGGSHLPGVVEGQAGHAVRVLVLEDGQGAEGGGVPHADAGLVADLARRHHAAARMHRQTEGDKTCFGLWKGAKAKTRHIWGGCFVLFAKRKRDACVSFNKAEEVRKIIVYDSPY